MVGNNYFGLSQKSNKLHINVEIGLVRQNYIIFLIT